MPNIQRYGVLVMNIFYLSVMESPTSQDKYDLICHSYLKKEGRFTDAFSSKVESSTEERARDIVNELIKPEDCGKIYYISARPEIIELFKPEWKHKSEENNNDSSTSQPRFILVTELPVLFDPGFRKKYELFTTQLNLITEIAGKLKERGFDDVALKAFEFQQSVLEATNLFIENPTKEKYLAFKETVNAASKVASPALGTHRGYKQLLGNMLLAILGFGVFYGIAVWKNGGLFFKTNSQENVDLVIAMTNDLEPLIPMAL